MGDDFRGDADAPAVLVRSDPRLGASMDIVDRTSSLWPIMLEHAQILDAQCGSWAIACNTLNHYAPRLASAGAASNLITYPAVVAERLDQWAQDRVALLGARPVAELGETSAYSAVRERFVPLRADVIDDLHALIHEVKIVGPAGSGLGSQLDALCDRVDADRFLLACTELPLIADPDDARLVDVTQLVANALVQRWLAI